MKMTVKADELQAGDRIVPAPGLRGPGSLIKSAESKIRVRYEGGSFYHSYNPDTLFEIERPEPTVTIEIPRSAAEFMADISWGSSKVQEFTKACHKALYPAPEPAKRAFVQGDRVVRENDLNGEVFTLTTVRSKTYNHIVVWYCKGEDGRVTWMAEYVFRLASEKPVLRVGAKVRRTKFESPKLGRYGVGTVTWVNDGGLYASVTGPNGETSLWDAAYFEVIG